MYKSDNSRKKLKIKIEKQLGRQFVYINLLNTCQIVWCKYYCDSPHTRSHGMQAGLIYRW
jgi:hypothetical protein